MFLNALDSLKISSVLKSQLSGPRWQARSHIVLEYNNEIHSPSLSQSNRKIFFALMINMYISGVFFESQEKKNKKKRKNRKTVIHIISNGLTWMAN